MNPTTIVRLTGGLGNQLFQYAAGRYRQQQTGGRLVLTDVKLGTTGATARRNELTSLHCQAELPGPLLRLLLALLECRGWRTQLPPLLQRWPLAPWSFVADQLPDFSTPHAITVLDGYWQDHRLIEALKPTLHGELQPAKPLPPAACKMLDLIQQSPAATAIHVRRADYASRPETLAHHGLCSPDYYSAATRWIAQRAPSTAWFIFSDDAAWVHQHRDLFPATATIVEPDLHQPWVDLHLMSHCQHCIIANSTFSWWGAWLGATQKKGMVIAPAQWFATAGEPPHLIPPSWVRL